MIIALQVHEIENLLLSTATIELKHEVCIAALYATDIFIRLILKTLIFNMAARTHLKQCLS